VAISGPGGPAGGTLAHTNRRARAAGHHGVVDPSAAHAIANAQAWFEVNSGWAPPDPDTLAEWVDDGVCRCPDDCLVTPEAWCEHGLASWWLILTALDG
jgi:hypothetical protein